MLTEWVNGKIDEIEKSLDSTREKINEMNLLEKEAKLLDTLGDNVL